MFVSSILRYGGGERWMLDAAVGLGSRGHPVHLVVRPASILAGRCGDLGIDSSLVQMRSDFDLQAIVNACVPRLSHSPGLSAAHVEGPPS
jgi:hypothetical protein